MSQFSAPHNAKPILAPLLFPLLILATVSFSSRLVRANDLESEYQRFAKETISKLRDAKIQTTGVLKFSVRVGDGPFQPNVGALNMRLAEKLELALVMANPAQESQAAKQIGIVRGASDVADSIAGASHITPNGRKLLFSKEYPLAWIFQGKSSTTPDSLIVGVAQLHADLRKMDIELRLLTKSDFELQPLGSLTVATDLEDLIDSGESFTTRGLFDDGSVIESEKKTELIVSKSLAIRQETIDKQPNTQARQHPLSPSSNAPIQFEVWYDNQRQSIELRDGAAFLKEPREGQKVSFIVSRNGSDKTRYGVLVRVNGENTLYRERLPDNRASIWIFEPSLPKFSIQGFQLDKGLRQEFKVLSEQESQKRIIDYGRDMGMISIIVFREQIGQKPTLSEDELDLAVQSRTKLPTTTATSRGQLARSLFDQLLSQDQTRGLIAEGQTKVANINTVTFERDATPIMATSIRYYSAR